MYVKDGRLFDEDGDPYNMHDYYGTLPYRKRYYDYNTINKSFLSVHKLLKDLGVKNNNELLQIFNKQLIGVNPHDPNLPDNVRMMIDHECRCNLWYYLREVVKVPIGDNMYPFDLNIGSFTITWMITRKQNFFYEISRQVGKTFLLTTILGWVLLFGGERYNMANIHHSKDPAITNLNAIKKSLDSIPAYLQYHKKEFDGEKVDKKTGRRKIKNLLAKSDNARSLENKCWKNRIDTIVVGGTLDSANRAGRGSTKEIYFIDEIPHIKFNNIAFGSLNQSTSTAKKMAKKVGKMSGTWLLGTPGKLNTPHGKWMYDKIKNEYLPFTLDNIFLYDYTQEELEDYIDKRSISNFWHVKFSWDILGFDEKWFFDKNRNEEVSGIRAEVLLNWEEQSLDNPFTRTEIAALEAMERRIIIKEYKYDDDVSFYMYPKRNENCNTLEDFILFNFRSGVVIGVDVANGLGKDSSTIYMIDPITLRCIATFKSNKLPADDLAILLVNILEKIFIPNNINCAVQIERNNSGATVVSIMKKYKHIQKYLIMYPVSEEKARDLTIPVDFEKDGKRYDFGINMTENLRKKFTEVLLFNYVKKHTEAYAVPEIVKEVKGLIKKNKNGKLRIDHSENTHDDLIFASLHALYPIYEAATILRKRHNIIVDPSKWILTTGVEVITGINSKKRIIKQFITGRDGSLNVRYHDTATNSYVSEEEAIRIQNEENKNAEEMVMTVEKQKELEEKRNADTLAGLYKSMNTRETPDFTGYFPEEVEEYYNKNNNTMANLYRSFNNVRR